MKNRVIGAGYGIIEFSIFQHQSCGFNLIPRFREQLQDGRLIAFAHSLTPSLPIFMPKGDFFFLSHSSASYTMLPTKQS